MPIVPPSPPGAGFGAAPAPAMLFQVVFSSAAAAAVPMVRLLLPPLHCTDAALDL